MLFDMRDCATRGDVIVTKSALDHDIVNPFTKVLMVKVFEDYLESLGLRDMHYIV